jgi:MerR family transcriptional regulator, light-induced transcriptional regulator
MPDDLAALPIGEVSRRTGVAVATLRAWEQRYDLLEPVRTAGGHRRYGDQDLARVRRMRELLDAGWGADAAARRAREEALERTVAAAAPPAAGGQGAAGLVERLSAAFGAFDAAAANDVLDDAFARFDPAAAFDEVLMPAMRVVGDGWETNPEAIAREHFASNVVRPRLLRLVRTPQLVATGRRCVAAAPELEDHDLGVLASAAVAAAAGFEVRFLGARTPTAALLRAAQTLRADLVLVGAVRRAPAQAFLDEAAPLLSIGGVVIGGAGFRAEDLDRFDGRLHRHGGDYADLPDTLRAALTRA